MSTTDETDRRLAEATRQVVPFVVAAVAAPLVSVGDGVSVHQASLVTGFVLLALSYLALVYVLARSLPHWVHNLFVFLSLGSLSLLVFGAGGTGSGATLVLLVPVVWMALYGTRLDVLVTLALMLVAVVVLTLSDGVSEITTSDVRRIVVFLTVPALAAWTVSSLVQRLAASEQHARTGQAVFASVVELAKRVGADPDPRVSGCEALLAVSGADRVTLWQLDASGHLTPVASCGHLTAPVPAFPADRVFVTNHAEGLAVLLEPFGQAQGARCLVQVVWNKPILEAPPHTANAITLLCEEVGMAIQRAELLSRLNRRATTDPLTGMGNRRVWRDSLPRLMDSGVPMCVALLDVDFFKVYNDTSGHAAGDALLVALAEAWSPFVRPEDLLVRWGGEEFAVALPDCALPQAVGVLERLRSVVPNGQTVSCGVACWDGSESIEALMSRADAALYRAKENGRDRIQVAGPATVGADEHQSVASH